MEFRLLGPLEASDGGLPLELGSRKQRALLAVLLLNANRTVAVERLVDELWGDSVPGSANKAVQVYVSQLRKVLPDGVLRTRAPGYLIEIDPDSVDLDRFERLVASGRGALGAGDAVTAAARLGEALALWRGPALAEFASEPFGQPESARLDELHLAALEDRIEADLALGRHADVVAELEALVGRHPLRERLRGQLMLALYRSDRQAEALAAYQDARRVLDDELGIEPSVPLRELERRILNQDEGLAVPPAPVPAVDRRVPVAGSARHGRGLSRVQYARSGEVNIAYQVTGDGSVDLVLVPGFVSHLEKDWEEPRHAHFLDGLGSFSRLIRFDKRGTGLSDRPGKLPDLETRMDDVRAVMDAVGSERAVLFGYSEGGPMAILFAATYPERVRALVLHDVFAKRLRSADYPWAPTLEDRVELADTLANDWGWEANMRRMCPSADEAMARWWGERGRAAASPGAARDLILMNSQIDVRDALPAVRVPTLVLHTVDNQIVQVEEARYIASRIPDATLVELAGVDHFVAMNADRILEEVSTFVSSRTTAQAPVVLGGQPARRGSQDGEPERVLKTILVSDLVGSTATAARLGDRAWSELLDAHHQELRGVLQGFDGEEVDMAGDGVLALFDGPARAIRAGLALQERLASLSLPVRVGIHTGEIERAGADARGIAVHVTARVAAEAEAGDVIVTATTRDLVAGSGLAFEDRGERTLKGLDEPRRLYVVLG